MLPCQSLMLAKAKECWEQEHEEREAEKARYLAERIPTLQTRGLSLSALQVSLSGGGPVGVPRDRVAGVWIPPAGRRGRQSPWHRCQRGAAAGEGLARGGAQPGVRLLPVPQCGWRGWGGAGRWAGLRSPVSSSVPSSPCSPIFNVFTTLINLNASNSREKRPKERTPECH